MAEYLQRVKIEGAKKQLKIGRKSISEVMTNVGYSDTQTFRNIFKRIAGVTPVDYKNHIDRATNMNWLCFVDEVNDKSY